MSRPVKSDEASVERVLDAFARTTDEIVTLDELRNLLRSGRQMRIKYGVDVTAPMMHIGHAVNLWMMRELQEIGHKVIFLIGDFTTRIGDPTGRDALRPVITEEEISHNADAFIEQVGKVLLTDEDGVEIRRNSEWFDDFPTSRFLTLMGMVTHERLLSRDMFRKRIEDGAGLYMHELTYPIIQGYDSVALESDLTIVGSDQLFNEMMGRFYQERFQQAPQVLITTKVTPGIDGKQKQSKSLGNYIGLDHDAREKFGRVMSIPDPLIAPYLEVYTSLPLARVAELVDLAATDPMEAKKVLGQAIVARYHGEEAAGAERRWFEEVFSKGRQPDDIEERTFSEQPATAFDLVRACLSAADFSNSKIRRLFEQGAVKLDGEKLLDFAAPVELSAEGQTLRLGKRTWFQVRLQGGD